MDAARIDFIPPAVYSELPHLQRTRSTLSPTEAVACALKLWMEQSAVARSPLRGYQWKELFLPDTTCLRMTYQESAAMLLIQHGDHQSTTMVERRLPKNRRAFDLMDDVH